MQRAEHSSWPITQLSWFNEGKEKLENYIYNYPNDIEARYIRYLVQEGSPGFLGYKDSIEKDKKFILNNIESANLPSSLITKMKAAVNS